MGKHSIIALVVLMIAQLPHLSFAQNGPFIENPMPFLPPLSALHYQPQSFGRPVVLDYYFVEYQQNGWSDQADTSFVRINFHYDGNGNFVMRSRGTDTTYRVVRNEAGLKMEEHDLRVFNRGVKVNGRRKTVAGSRSTFYTRDEAGRVTKRREETYLADSSVVTEEIEVLYELDEDSTGRIETVSFLKDGQVVGGHSHQYDTAGRVVSFHQHHNRKGRSTVYEYRGSKVVSRAQPPNAGQELAYQVTTLNERGQVLRIETFPDHHHATRREYTYDDEGFLRHVDIYSAEGRVTTRIVVRYTFP